MYGYLILDINVGKKNFIKMFEVFNDLGLLYSFLAILICITFFLCYNNDK